MSFADALGDRMKEYENVTRAYLPRRTYTIIRVDGRSFHNVTRDMEKPFSYDFIGVMATVTRDMCQQIQGAVFAYHQSDEISILCQDFANSQTQPWFGGNINKIVSISAALATARFNVQLPLFGITSPALFDSRVFTISSRIEVMNYFIWRQKDAIRNSVSMAAQTYFSHKSLQGLNSKQLQEKLWAEASINWNDYPSAAKRGQVIREMVSPMDDDGPVDVSWLVDPYAPDFKVEPESYLDRIIPRIPDL